MLELRSSRRTADDRPILRVEFFKTSPAHALGNRHPLANAPGISEVRVAAQNHRSSSRDEETTNARRHQSGCTASRILLDAVTTRSPPSTISAPANADPDRVDIASDVLRDFQVAGNGAALSEPVLSCRWRRKPLPSICTACPSTAEIVTTPVPPTPVTNIGIRVIQRRHALARATLPSICETPA